MQKPTFKPGDKVCFNDEYWPKAQRARSDTREWISQDRTYTIERVRAVEARNQWGVGHHQMVDLVEDPRSKFNGPNWSGAFFALVTPISEVIAAEPVNAEPCGIADPSTRDCPNMKEVGGGMEGERYRCAVCGKGYFLDYEEMK